MYPLNMKLIDGVGFAVANDEAEHQALSGSGYGPAFVPAPKTKATKAAAEPAAE